MAAVTPSYGRLSRRVADLQFVQQATAAIMQLNESLDRQLLTEPRPAERLRMLRETTNQITRAANDAIQAYRRARGAIQAELEMPSGDRLQAQSMRDLLDSARADVLGALETTSRRYTWAEPWPAERASATISPARLQRPPS